MSMSQPRQHPRWRSPAIEDVAVISNGQGELALLDRSGGVTSGCLPNGDGVPVVHELYDAPWRTSFSLGLDGKKFPVKRRMEDTSHTLVSTWMDSTGLASERACMVGSPSSDDGGQMVRLLTCEQGTVNARLELCLRYGFRGEQPVQWTVLRSRAGFTELTAVAGSMRLFLATNMQLEFDELSNAITGRLVLTAGESAFVWLGWRDHSAPATIEEAASLIEKSDAGWLKWAQGLQLPDDENAFLVLESSIRHRGLGHRAGSYYAAASRSIPEDDPDEHGRECRCVRCWDYLFAWLRDFMLGVFALDDVGDDEVLLAAKRWCDNLPDLRRNAKIMYGIRGEDVAQLGEHIVDELGYRGSIFRYGNGAGDQEQNDRWVYPLELLRRLATRGQFDLDLTEGLAEQAAAAMFQPCSGVWEVRREGSEDLVVYTGAQLLNGQALYHASEIFKIAGMEYLAKKYKALADKVKAWVLENCVEDGVLVAAPGLHVLDSSVLLAFLMGKEMFDLDDPRDELLVRTTVLAIDRPHTAPAPFKGLRVGKGHVRYHTDEFNDGISLEREALFTNISGWVAQMLLRLGMLERSDAIMRELVSGRNDLGMYSEERTEDGRALGNVNQAYVYQVVIAYYLERAAFVAADGRRTEADVA